MSARLSRSLRGAAILLALGGGGAPALPEVVHMPVTFVAESDPGEPLAGVRITAGEHDLGLTDERGTIASALDGPPGSRVPIAAACPEGHREAAPVAPIVVQPAMTLSGAIDELRVRIRCAPTERTVALLVHTHGEADVPVRALGREVARTGPGGVAHAVLRVAPGTTVRASLDLSERADLEGAAIEHIVEVGDRDEVVVLDQALTRRARRSTHRRRAEPEASVEAPSDPEPQAPAAPEPELPQRITGASSY